MVSHNVLIFKKFRKMPKVLAILLLNLILTVIFSDTYIVAVVEYNIEEFNTLNEAIIYDLSEYISIINDTIREHKDLDLIVFPDLTMVGSSQISTKAQLEEYASYLPDNYTIIPCLDADKTISEYVKQLSCASRDHHIYVSVVITSRNAQGELFHTNIVFDRDGRIISRYNRMKLLETETHITPGNKVEYFKTDFNMTFGVLISLDILYADFKELLNNHQVNAFIFTSSWITMLPQYISIEMHQSWSYLHDIPLIVSASHSSSMGMSGIGVFSGRSSPYNSYISSQDNHKVLVTEMAKDVCPIYFPKNHIRQLENFNFQVTNSNIHIHNLIEDTPNKNISQTVCDGDFCCTFQLNVNDTTGLKFATNNGNNPIIDGLNLGTKMCVLLQCEDNDCFTLPKETYFCKKYAYIEVTVTTSSNNTDYYPRVALKNLQFLPFEKYIFDEKKLHLRIMEPVLDLHMFGYYGRYYDNDDSANFI